MWNYAIKIDNIYATRLDKYFIPNERSKHMKDVTSLLEREQPEVKVGDLTTWKSSGRFVSMGVPIKVSEKLKSLMGIESLSNLN